METILEDWWHDALSVRILVAGRRELGTWWRYDFGEGIAPWRIYLNERDGAGLDFADGRRFEIPGGTVVLLPGGLRFRTRAWAPTGHFYVHFDVAGMPRLPRALLEGPLVFPEATGVRALIGEVTNDLLRSAPRLELQWRLKAVVHDVLARLIARSGAADDDRLDVSPRFGAVRPALRHIQERYDGPLGVAELADRCNLSPDHFARTFREVTGKTPGRYVAEFRAHLAAERLVSGDETLDAIAAACGFAHRSHLSRVFAEVMGVRPSEYRRRARTAVTPPVVDPARRPVG